MKTLKILIFSALFMCVPFLQSCSDDDKVNIDDMYGKWQYTTSEGYYWYENEKEEWTDDYTSKKYYIEFDEDGTFTEWTDTKLTDEGFWHINGRTLILDDGDDYIIEWKIEKLTPNTLTLSEEGVDEDGPYYSKENLVKIK